MKQFGVTSADRGGGKRRGEALGEVTGVPTQLLYVRVVSGIKRKPDMNLWLMMRGQKEIECRAYSSRRKLRDPNAARLADPHYSHQAECCQNLGQQGFARYSLCSFADSVRRKQIQRLPARRFGRSVRKYLRTNGPSRPFSEPPQDKHVISQTGVGSRGPSARTSKYFAAQFGHSNRVEGELDMTKRLIESLKENRQINGSDLKETH